MKIKEALEKRENTYHGIYSDVGSILDKFKTEEMVEYFIKELNGESCLRYYLEQQITANEIEKAKVLSEESYDDFSM